MNPSRWLDWKPKAGILAGTADSESTQRSKPGFVGFEGAIPAEYPAIRADRDPAELACASAVLNRAGVRIMALEGGATIGVWSDLDGPEVRTALRTLGSGRLPIRYPDGVGVPMRYKVRRVNGEPVPMNVLAEMERNPVEPWNVRDRMLHEIGWRSKPLVPTVRHRGTKPGGNEKEAARRRFRTAGIQEAPRRVCEPICAIYCAEKGSL